MRRFALLLALAASASGCVSFTGLGGTYAGGGGLDPMDATPQAYNFQPSTLTKVGNAVLSVPETVVWWPYKIVSSTLRGGYDGVAGGLSNAPVPALGVVAAPFTAAAGLVNGTVSGVTRGPAYVGTTEEFTKALKKPWTEPLPLWKK
jgi:hypothetical protein